MVRYIFLRKWGGILERVSRRQFLKGLIGGLVAGGIIGAGITYVAAPEALRREITGQPSPQPGPFTSVPSRPDL
jgi:hypothetical protein